MTSAVIIFLREVLEAMLIVSLLLASSTILHISRKWIGLAILIGAACSGIYAILFDRISDSFEGIGQEIVNAILLFSIYLCLAIYAKFIMPDPGAKLVRIPLWLGIMSMVMAVVFAVTREGVELYVYLSGYLPQPETLLPVLLGGVLGSGIGLSLGALIYYAVKFQHRTRGLIISSLFMIPVAAGMTSQASNYLIQADLLPSQMPLWNTSAIIPETSVIGELLYAVFSYEATPTPLQVVIYLGSALALLVSLFAGRLLRLQGIKAAAHD